MGKRSKKKEKKKYILCEKHQPNKCNTMQNKKNKDVKLKRDKNGQIINFRDILKNRGALRALRPVGSCSPTRSL
jgi:hypothetical protein